MKLLLSLLLLVSIPAFGAQPSYQAFRGAGGITIVSNPPGGTIVIDGSGVFTSGTNSTIAIKTNGVAVSNTAMTNNFTAGNNTVLKGTNTSGTAHIDFGMASNLTFNSALGPLVLGTWGQQFGISNGTLGELVMWMDEPDTSSEVKFQDNIIVGGVVVATNFSLTAIPGTGPLLGINSGGQAFRTNASGMTISNANLLFVDTGGNDATAVRGLRGSSWRTVVNAVSNAVSGDTVVVFPGEYPNSTNLFKNGVNLLGYPGAWLSYTNKTNDRGIAIFDDRWIAGGVTSVISGFSLRHSCGNDMTNAGFSPGFGPTNVLGTVVVTNPLSFIQASFDRIEYDDFIIESETAALCLFNGNGFVRVNDIIDTGLNVRRSIGIDPGVPEDVFVPSQTIGTWWKEGEWHVDVRRNVTSRYSVYFHSDHTNSSGNLWFNSDYCFGKVYSSTKTMNQNWKGWVDIKEVRVTNANDYAATFLGDMGGVGKYYLKIDKIGSAAAPAFNMTAGQEVWLDCQKMSGFTGWIDMEDGILHANVGHFEDTGMVDKGIWVRGGNLDLHGLQATVTNVTGSAVKFDSGTMRVSRLHITTPNSTNNPVVVSTNGLVLQTCAIQANTNRFSIRANASQSVALKSCWMNTDTTNILGLVGPWTVDSNVR